MRTSESCCDTNQRGLDAVLAATGECICTLNPSGHLVWANPAARQMLGLAAVDLGAFCFIQRLQPLGTKADGRRAILTAADGRKLSISYRLNQIDNGLMAGQESAVVVFHDSADDLKREHELQQACEAKGHMLATLSHEIRTPLTGILGMMQLFGDANLNAEQRTCLESIQESAQSLLQVLNNILDSARVEAGHLALATVPFDVRALLEGVQRNVAAEAKRKSLELSCVVDSRIAPILLGDPTRLRQVLLNLAANAVKFTPGGFVEVAAKALAVRDAAVEVEFHVRDSGIGIDPKYHESIFQLFSQGDSTVARRFGGTGLGLTICSQLAEAMGGAIYVDSTPGLGSDFRFTISLATPTRDETAVTSGVHPLNIKPVFTDTYL